MGERGATAVSCLRPAAPPFMLERVQDPRSPRLPMAREYDSELAKKMNFPSGTRVRVVAPPEGVDLSGLATTDAGNAGGVVVFVRNLAEVATLGGEAVEAVRAGRITWMAYPKARQLGTDLNRDILWKEMKTRGIDANRQISIDDTWSAMRFRPGE